MLELRIPLKDKIKNPIVVDGIDFYIDYPTAEQEEFLERLLVKVWNIGDPKRYRAELKELKAELDKADKNKRRILNKRIAELEHLITNDSVYVEANNEAMSYMLKYQRYVIKFCVKDFGDNVTDTEGNQLKCKLINNELDENLWWALVRDPVFAIKLYQKISEAIELSYTDKKKFSS